MTEVVRYEISSDGKGLLGYLNTGNFYHIHSDDMSELETWIYNILREKDDERIHRTQRGTQV